MLYVLRTTEQILLVFKTKKLDSIAYFLLHMAKVTINN